MAAQLATKKAIRGALALAQQISKLPATNLWLDYDTEADVLYISLDYPRNATNTIEHDDGGILLCYRGKKLVGVDVLNACTR